MSVSVAGRTYPRQQIEHCSHKKRSVCQQNLGRSYWHTGHTPFSVGHSLNGCCAASASAHSWESWHSQAHCAFPMVSITVRGQWWVQGWQSGSSHSKVGLQASCTTHQWSQPWSAPSSYLLCIDVIYPVVDLLPLDVISAAVGALLILLGVDVVKCVCSSVQHVLFICGFETPPTQHWHLSGIKQM